MGSDKKKPYNPLTDLTAPLRGVKNIVSGRIFDGESWDDEKDFAHHLGAGKKVTADDDDGEFEETTTTTVRQRGKRRTVTAAPTEKRTEGSGDGDDGGGKPPAKGKAAGKQNEGKEGEEGTS